jgi:large subunit ribosomal protein L6
MSRIGKKVIPLPSGVVFDYNEESHTVSVKGSLGELKQKFTQHVNFNVDSQSVDVVINDPSNGFQNAIWGTTRSIVNNMVEGVSKGFTKEIELNGVGFRMELGSELTLFIGFSHPVKVQIPSAIKLSLNKNLLSGTSIDKELIGNFFSQIYHLKPCDVYKHKGFKFPGQFYRKKVGKKSK